MLLGFQNHLQTQFPELMEAKLLVAISGGVDSVVLAHLCKDSGLDFSLIHCNFHLRTEESNQDEEFILELAESLEVQVFVEHFETQDYAEEKKISIQMAARELRYRWFEELRSSLSFDYVLTAHHANDNLETFLINLVRGTGLEGLTGIPKRNEFILRPLLPFSREAIEDFARNNRLPWREDSSNSSTKYLRNKIRHDLVPVLLELNPQLLESFEKTQSHLRQSSHLVEDYISALFPQVATETKFGYSFKIKLLKTLPHLEAGLYELFRSFGFTEWDDVCHLLDAESGKMVLSSSHRLVKDREDLLLTPLPQKGEEYQLSDGEDVIMLPIGTFHFETVEKVGKTDSNSIYVQKDKLIFPLRLRHWKTGDFFHPFGMEGKKKLSKFFKDNKLSLPEKEHCWVMCSDGHIVWVVQQRADGRFAVENETSEILKITFVP